MQGLESLEFRDRLGRRLIRCVIGLSLFAIGISLQMNANIGAPPWDVFHQGIAEQTGISIGKVIVITGFALLLLWIPLKQKPGLGTILNALDGRGHLKYKSSCIFSCPTNGSLVLN